MIQTYHREAKFTTAIDIVSNPDNYDDIINILDKIKDHGQDVYQVEREIQVTDEHYEVYTKTPYSSKSYHYKIRQNDSGEWYVSKKLVTYGKYNKTQVRKAESTEAVREAMKERYDIELQN